MTLGRRFGDDGGSTTVEFVGGLLVLATVTVALIQVAVYVYARQVASSAAAEGARRAATVDATLREGTAVARVALEGGLGSLADGLQVRTQMYRKSVEVVVSGTVPGLGIVPDLPVTARALVRDEDAVVPGGVP